MPLKARALRGQAIVETALGILVFISVLMFGIHFAEVTFTQMKVTEAAQAAIWDSTAGQMHILPLNFAGARTNVRNAMNSANRRYADFDGRSDVDRARPPQGLFSSARQEGQPGAMRVLCELGVRFYQSGADASPLGLKELQDLVYRDNGGMSCNASAVIDPFGIMRIGAFLEDANGFFSRAKHRASVTQTDGYFTCAIGRPDGLNGRCTRGDFTMLIDDWGLASGGNEGGTCRVVVNGLPCFGNPNYWTSTEQMYTSNSRRFDTQDQSDFELLSLVSEPLFWGRTSYGPGTPTSFYMSFAGQGSKFRGSLAGIASDTTTYEFPTTPYEPHTRTYTRAHTDSKGGYLGIDWGAPTFSIDCPGCLP